MRPGSTWSFTACARRDQGLVDEDGHLEDVRKLLDAAEEEPGVEELAEPVRGAEREPPPRRRRPPSAVGERPGVAGRRLADHPAGPGEDPDLAGTELLDHRRPVGGAEGGVRPLLGDQRPDRVVERQQIDVLVEQVLEGGAPAAARLGQLDEVAAVLGHPVEARPERRPDLEDERGVVDHERRAVAGTESRAPAGRRRRTAASRGSQR